MSFKVTVRTAAGTTHSIQSAASAMAAFTAAADAQGDTLCGITVTPAGAQ